ncbi:hypothetical protein [Fibrisoma limi]|uniref:hypothetical protein n=1 Tax=Fibrisoma limi TaxID=663275 RepID=UPI001E2D8779|nr:hypothetical protein [Fibrisoma limi]
MIKAFGKLLSVAVGVGLLTTACSSNESTETTKSSTPMDSLATDVIDSLSSIGSDSASLPQPVTPGSVTQ